MNQPNIFDGRNLYKIEKAQKAGLNYVSVGRKNLNIKVGQNEAA